MLQARQKRVEAARGLIPLDLIIENVRLVNIFTGEIYPAEIGIFDGVIVHIAEKGKSAAQAHQRYDGQGKFALPGLVDTHIHIESSMMAPARFAEAVLPHGTTTVVIDPHEIGNVVGKRGIQYMLEATANLPLRVFVQVPSCVPAVHGIETAGASFGAADVEEMLGWDRVIGLAEVMDYFGVINQTERMQGIVEAALEKNVPVSGHCLGLSGMDLSAYLVAGPASDHEANNYEELLEKLRAGMTVEGRVSSFVESMSPLGRIVQELGEAPPNLVMCTDDLFPEDIIQNGHMDHVVRKGIGAGIPPVQAVRAATYNGAQRHRLYDLGALAPGKLADILLVPDFEHFTPDEVFAGGVLVAKAGKMLVELNDSAGNPLESENTVHLPFAPQAGRFQLPAREDRSTEQVNVLVTHPDFTRTLERLTLPVKDGWVDITDYPELCWVSIIERHGGNGNHSLGVIKGTGLREGALASTVAHDCHNLTIIGRNPEDMATAAAALTECGGGVAYASSGKVQSVLPLPIGGLMSPLGLDEMMQQMEAINQTLRPAGMQSVAGIFALALPVIPDYGFTDYGLVDVRSQTVLPVLST